MYFFGFDRPVGIVVIGAISIVHSVFHVPHGLMYRYLGILTAFWSIAGLGLIFGAILEYETFYIIWIWFSCMYVPIMLITMTVKLTTYVFELELQPWRIFMGVVAILFYLLMLYCITYVYNEKRKIFTTTTTTTTATSTSIKPHLRIHPTQRILYLPGILHMQTLNDNRNESTF